MPLADHTTHEANAFDLCESVLAFYEMIRDPTGRAAVNFRLYTKDSMQDSSVSCNDSVDKRPAGTPADDKFDKARPDGPDCNENKDAADSAARQAHFFENLIPQRLYWLCSPTMRMHLDIAKEGRAVPDEHDFELAAIRRLPELGINSSAWAEAGVRMGAERATICVLLTDANMDNPDNPIRSPGGCLRDLERD